MKVTYIFLLGVFTEKFWMLVFDNEDMRKFKLVAENRPLMNVEVMQKALLNEEKSLRQMVINKKHDSGN